MSDKKMTMRELFFKRNPDAPQNADGHPLCCPWNMGYDQYNWDTVADHCEAIGSCENCWSRAVKKERIANDGD